MPKISVDKLMQDIVSINNQINGMKLLLEHKKAVIAKYFDSSGHKSLTNDEATVYVQERTSVQYDIEELEQRLPKDVLAKFVESNYRIYDWHKFVMFCKRKGIKASELRPLISVEKQVNQSKLTKLYERGVIEPSELTGCYTCTVKKNIALRMKNVDTTIPITQPKSVHSPT